MSRRSKPHHRLIGRQPSNNILHLSIGVNPEALVLGHACQLHVLAIQLLFHNLLQCLEDKHLGLC